MQETGMVDLGSAPGGIYSIAWGTSADGSVVVGVGDVDSFDVPTYWNATDGMRSLIDILVELGLGPAVEGWSLQQATAVSADGQTVTGWGYNPEGDEEAWIAYLGPAGLVEIPTTSRTALALFGAFLASAAVFALRLR
jgi:uncharacterized membrane protein